MEMAVFYSKEEQYGAEPCFASSKQSFETVVANSRSETLNIPCKPLNLHASCDAAGYFSLFCPTFIELQLGQKQSHDGERHAAANGRGQFGSRSAAFASGKAFSERQLPLFQARTTGEANACA